MRSRLNNNTIWCLFLILFCFYSQIHCVNAQLAYHIEGFYKGYAAQGMAIYDHKAYLLNSGGICRVMELKSGQIVGEFFIQSKDNNHCNSASFGCERVKGNKVPVMYISQCNLPHKCFVESMTDSCSVLVQTISICRNGEDGIVHDWVVDSRHKVLYAVVSLKRKGEQIYLRHKITRYRLPQLSEGKDVELTDADAYDSFEVQFPNLLQGAAIKGNLMYLPTGCNSKSEGNPDVGRREVIVVNLKKRTIVRKIDLMQMTDCEPEDCDFYRGKLLVYCGQKGGLYHVSLK